MIGGKLTFGALIIAGLACAAAYWQYSVANALRADLATERANVETAKAEIRGLNENIRLMAELRARDQRHLAELGEATNRIAEERDEAKAKLDDFRGRLGRAALKAPDRISRRASAATLRVMRQIFRATGGRAPDEADRASAPAAAPAGGPDRGGGARPDAGGDGGAPSPGRGG